MKEYNWFWKRLNTKNIIINIEDFFKLIFSNALIKLNDRCLDN